MFVYALLDEKGFPRYIGKTNDPKVRLSNHWTPEPGRNTHSKNWVRKLRREGYKPTMLLLEESLSEEQAFEEEIFYISYFTYLGANLTNQTEGGEGISGYKHSVETRRKMSEKRSGKNHHFFGVKGASNPNFGQKRPEAGKKISAALLGKKLTPEHKENLRKANVGRKQSSETKAKRRATILSRGGYKGRKHSTETIIHMSGSNNPRFGKLGKDASGSKPCLQLEQTSGTVLNEFDSASSAARAMGISSGAIAAACRKGNCSCGFFWRYKMTLQVQKYLLTHSLIDLANEHGVYARLAKNKHKASFNYDQIEAKDGDPIAEECRGLILGNLDGSPIVEDGIVGHLTVFGNPFSRFYNFGQGACAPVDFNHPETRFLEKCDGSLLIVYHDHILKEWACATRAVPDADLPMDGFEDGQTFSDLFWKAAEATTGLSRADFCKGLSGLWTYCFELCTPDNQVVVRYEDHRIWLLAVRDTLTGEEMDPREISRSYQAGSGVVLPCVPSYRFGSIGEMLDFVSSREPSKFEGIVVCDQNYQRAKVKNVGYLALNRIKDAAMKSPRSVMEVILLGQEDDVMPLIPVRTQEYLLDLKGRLRGLLRALDEEYDRLYHPDRKTFALAIQEAGGFMPPHMSRWSGKCSNSREWISTQKKEGSWGNTFLDTLMKMCKGCE